MNFHGAMYSRMAGAPPEWMRIAQSTALVRHLPAVILCNGLSLVALATVAAASHSVPNHLPELELVVLLLLVPLCSSWLRLRRSVKPDRVSARRIQHLNLYSLLLGASWAALGAVCVPQLPFALGMCVAGALVAMSVCALAGFSFLPLGCLAFALPVFAGAAWAVGAMLASSPLFGLIFFVMAVVVFIGTGMMWFNWGQFVERTQMEASADAKVCNRAGGSEELVARSRFVRAASHDLGQPIHALSLYLGTLAHKALPAEARSLVSDARDCVQQMNEMFRDLSALSRLDAGGLVATEGEYEANLLLDSVKAEYEALARSRSLTFRVRRSAAIIRADASIATHIISNLVSNAMRYVRTGGVLVGCRVRQGMLRVEVYDTGPGIEAQLQSFVFEAYDRADSECGGRARRPGFGLVAVRRLAGVVGASIGVRSRPGRGSCFYVDFPLARAVEWPQHTSSEVVVVHHAPATLEPAIKSLRQSGIRVISGLSSAEVLARLQARSRAPDAIVCNDRLPGGQSGIQAIEAVREEFNMDIPAVLIRSQDVSAAEDFKQQEMGLMVIDRHQAVMGIAPAVMSLLGQSGISNAGRMES
jgi:signal transduction histidine kinase